VNLLRQIERRALALPDLLIQDTADYVDWLHETYGVSKERFRLVPTGRTSGFTGQFHLRQVDGTCM
jgi:hypothetical protein